MSQNYPLFNYYLQIKEQKSELDLSALIFDSFLLYVANDLKIDLYPHQEEAFFEILAGNHLILNTPTGSGKSLVALMMHFRSMILGRQSIYTSPIKALVNEKFISLCYEFGPQQVGLITGDGKVNPKAPILCVTQEILMNMALKSGDTMKTHDLIIDEFHYYGDKERGMAWQIPLLTIPHGRFLLMSATLGDVSFFATEIEKMTNIKCSTILEAKRPVPLSFSYEEFPLEMVVEKLVQLQKCPIYLVAFTQRECGSIAHALTCVNYASKEEKLKILNLMEGHTFQTPYGKELQRLLKHGIGIHHAGLLPRYRLLVEKLSQKGALKIIVGTDTLGVGINVPIKTVLLTRLCKYNGEKTTLLLNREFQQISGRAGRKGHDDEGFVVVMAPSYIIENKMNEEKAKLKGGKVKAKVQAPQNDKTFFPWKKSDFDRYLTAPPETLKSQFKLSPGILLQLLSRPYGGCSAAKNLIRNCHESDPRKKQLRSEAMQMFRSLVERNIIEFYRPPQKGMTPLRLHLDLQDDFALFHTHSLFIVDAIEYLDPYHEDYALKVLSLAESVLENPEVILRKQLDKLKSDTVLELKANGVPYEERMEILEKLEHPKPEADFLYNTFNLIKKSYPYAVDETIFPKSVAREMYETLISFNDYIREYQLERSEGPLLRYLTDVYKVLEQTIPEKYKNEPVMDMILYFKALIKEIDSSLLDEWEKISDPELFSSKEAIKKSFEEENKKSLTIFYDEQNFIQILRNQVIYFLRAIAYHHYEKATEFISNGEKWSKSAFESALIPFYNDHQEILFTPLARQKIFFTIDRSKEKEEVGRHWIISQRILDNDQDNDYEMHFTVDIDLSIKNSKVELSFEKFNKITDN